MNGVKVKIGVWHVGATKLQRASVVVAGRKVHGSGSNITTALGNLVNRCQDRGLAAVAEGVRKVIRLYNRHALNDVQLARGVDLGKIADNREKDRDVRAHTAVSLG